MDVQFSQFYVKPGVEFPFSIDFQIYLSNQFATRLIPSPLYVKKFGEDYALVFYISAKRRLKYNQIAGPSISRKARDISYTIFLPFTVISATEDPHATAIEHILHGAMAVCQSLEIDCEKVRKRQAAIIKHIIARPKMFETDD
jgi:hypothetical protein